MRTQQLLVIIAAITLAGGQRWCWAQDRSERVKLADKTDLARLIDLCASRLGISYEYDPALLKAMPVTLRLESELSGDELLALTNQLLASRGLTTVASADGKVLQVVKLAEATDRAQVGIDAPTNPNAGFASIVTPVRHIPAKEAAELVRGFLSKGAGSVSTLGASGLLVISDLKPKLDQAVELLMLLDMPGPQPEVRVIALQHAAASTLATLLTSTVEAQNSMRIAPLQGKLRAVPDTNSLVLIAPVEEFNEWTSLIARFDQRDLVETRTYVPLSFPASEVASLIEQAVRQTGVRGAGERWRVVVDGLTGSLIVTATPSEHEQIAALFERLDSIPAAARQPIRTFVIKHRTVTEIVDLVNRLLQQGAMEGSDQLASGSHALSSPPIAASQQSQRDVLPPAGSLGQPSQPILSPSAPRTDSTLGLEASAVQPSSRGSSATQPRSRRSPGTGDGGAGSGAPRPLLSLTADEATNTLIAVGEPRLLAQLEGLLRVLDVRQPQVMLEAMVISLNDADTLDLGVEIQKLEVSGSTLISLSSLFGLGIPAAASSVLPNPTGSGFTGLALNPGDFSVLIRALQTLNDGRALSMPKVLVNNNQDASLDAVLQQPFTSTNASTTVATTSFGGTQDAGTTITVKPQIASGDELVLTYSVALSSFVGESSDPNIPPPRQQNTVSSVVRIPDGYTVVVGGLELKTDSKAVTQIPLLGDIPFLGELFKNRSNSDSTTRFYVFIRAAILRHEDFEDLKYLSDRDAKLAEIDDGWPEVKPRVIR